MNLFSHLFRNFPRWTCGALLIAVGFAGSGCQIYRNLGSGQRMESTDNRPHHTPSNKQRDMQAEVITDASGAVVSVRFLRSSGSSAVDDYVAESIRTSWQHGPSMKSVVELTYSQAKGFSEPKFLSETPVQ